MITISCCSIVFRAEPITGLLPRFAETGFDAVEIFGAQLEGQTDRELKEVRRIADDTGIIILAAAPYFSFTRKKSDWDESVERAKFLVHASHILGAKKMRTFTDVGPTGIGSDVATEAQWEQGVLGLRTIAALDTDMTFVLETHPLTLCDTVDSTIKVLTLADQPNLKVLYQPTTFINDGVIECYDRLKNNTAHMHLNNKGDDGSIWIENGVIDYPAFFKHIKDDGYDGSVSLEYCCKGGTWEKVESGLKFIKQGLR